VDAIGAALKELEKAGYIIRNQIRGERGRIVETEYVIYEQPQSKPPPLPPSPPEPKIPPTPAGSGLSPHTAFPYTEKPDLENPSQYITNKSTKKIESKNVLNTQSIRVWKMPRPIPVPTLPLKETDRLTGQRKQKHIVL